jgi:hypothetical protein
MNASPITTMDNLILDRMREALAEHRERLLADFREIMRQEIAAGRTGFTGSPVTRRENLSAEDIAEEIRRPVTVVRKWLRTGALKGRKIGMPGKERTWLVPRSSLDAFLQGTEAPERPVRSIDEQVQAILEGTNTRPRESGAETTGRRVRRRMRRSAAVAARRA